MMFAFFCSVAHKDVKIWTVAITHGHNELLVWELMYFRGHFEKKASQWPSSVE